jgi:Condensation domain
MTSGTPIPEIVDEHGLTPAQLGLLFHVLSEPDEHLFVERLVCPLHGELDIRAFARAWRGLVDRHGSLRTAFLCDSSEGPKQIIYGSAELDIVAEDWSGLSAAERSAKVEITLAEELERGFDLARPPLMRLKLARVSSGEHLLFWSSHHLILDGWSCWILLCEAALLYIAGQHGMLVDLPEAPGFVAYSRWLENEGGAEKHGEYWATYFEGYQPPQRQIAARSGRRDFHQDRSHLPRSLTAAIGRWQRRTRLTLNTLLQAAWALVLAQELEHGPEEAIFGTVFSGRSAGFPGITNVVGLLIRVLPVRIPLHSEMPASEWLGLLQNRHSEMLLHQSCTVQEVQRWAAIERTGPLFESVLLVMNVDPLDRLPPLGFKVGRPRYIANATYPLGVNVTPGEEMAVEMLYDARYFGVDRIQRLQSVFAASIECILEAAGETVGGLQKQIRTICRRSGAQRQESIARVISPLSAVANSPVDSERWQ